MAETPKPEPVLWLPDLRDCGALVAQIRHAQDGYEAEWFLHAFLKRMVGTHCMCSCLHHHTPTVGCYACAMTVANNAKWHQNMSARDFTVAGSRVETPPQERG